jgi:hypothetical protein
VGQAFGSLNRNQGCRGRGLAMVNVADCADVAVRLIPLKYFLGHCFLHLLTL